MQLPSVQGRNLLRQKKSFPEDFAGSVNLVFVAFLRRHQDLIDEWVPIVEELANDYPDLHIYEFPTLPSSGPIYRIFLNEGMRAGIPDHAARERTVTLYLNKRQFRAALDIADEHDMWLYLFDRQGRVLWRTAGRAAEEKIDALRRSLANHIGGIF